MVNRCVMCVSDSESVMHLFSECVVSRTLYLKVAHKLQIRLPCTSQLIKEDAISAIVDSNYTRKERAILLITQFILWRERCSIIFREQKHDIQELLDRRASRCTMEIYDDGSKLRFKEFGEASCTLWRCAYEGLFRMTLPLLILFCSFYFCLFS